MRKLWGVIFLILIIPGFTSAQSPDFRSQSNSTFLSNYQMDSLPITHWLNYGNQVIYRDPDSAMILYREAFKLGLLNGYYSVVCKALLNIGSCYGVKNDYRSAILHYRKALPYFVMLLEEREQILSDFNANMGVAYFKLGINDSAISHLLNALEIATKAKDTLRMIHLYANLSGVKSASELYPQSIQYAHRAIQFAEDIRDSTYLSQLYGILATAAINTGERERSLDYMHQSYRFARDANQRSYALSKMGEIYLSNKMPDSALFYLNQFLILNNKTKTPVSQDIYSNIGISYHLLKQDEKAIHFMKLAESAAKKNEDTLKTVNLTSTWYMMAKILNNQHRYKEALHYLFLYIDLRDSLLSAARNAAIDSLEIKYQIAEKDRELSSKLLLLAQEQQKVDQRNFWLILTLSGSLALVIIASIFFYNLKNKQRTQLQLLRQEKEINLLRATAKGEERERTRIAYELHDGIGGMLAAIKMNFGAVRQRYEKLYGLEELNPLMEMLEDTTKELRNTAHNLMPGILASHNLAEALQIWCSNVNVTEKLNISLRLNGISDMLPKDIELMLYRMIQELVQNIIKHAHASHAEIDLSMRDGEIHIFVEDDGLGFNSGKNSEGFGLQNLRYRVQALQGELYIDTAEGKGTAVSIRLDFAKIKMAFTK